MLQYFETVSVILWHYVELLCVNFKHISQLFLMLLLLPLNNLGWEVSSETVIIWSGFEMETSEQFVKFVQS